MSDLRICADPDCTTILSRFNDTDYCAAHPQFARLPIDETRPYEKLGNLPPRKSQAAYMKAYRSAKPGYAKRNSELNSARHSAALKVARQHPSEFERAFTEICEARDIAP